MTLKQSLIKAYQGFSKDKYVYILLFMALLLWVLTIKNINIYQENLNNFWLQQIKNNNCQCFILNDPLNYTQGFKFNINPLVVINGS